MKRWIKLLLLICLAFLMGSCAGRKVTTQDRVVLLETRRFLLSDQSESYEIGYHTYLLLKPDTTADSAKLLALFSAYMDAFPKENEKTLTMDFKAWPERLKNVVYWPLKFGSSYNMELLIHPMDYVRNYDIERSQRLLSRIRRATGKGPYLVGRSVSLAENSTQISQEDILFLDLESLGPERYGPLFAGLRTQVIGNPAAWNETWKEIYRRELVDRMGGWVLKCLR